MNRRQFMGAILAVPAAVVAMKRSLIRAVAPEAPTILAKMTLTLYPRILADNFFRQSPFYAHLTVKEKVPWLHSKALPPS